MEGSSARGQKVGDVTALLADLSSASTLYEFRSKLIRGIGARLRYSEPIVLLTNPESGEPSIDTVECADESGVSSVSVKSHLEDHPELLRKLVNGDIVGISRPEAAGSSDRRNAILVPIIHGGLIGVIGLVLGTDAPSVPEEELEEVRQISHFAAPLLSRIHEIESLRGSKRRLAASHERISELESELSALREGNDGLNYLMQMQAHLHSNIAHELRTPLATIRGYTRMILDGRTGEVSATQRDYLTIVAENTNRLIQLVNWTSHISQMGAQYLELSASDLGRIWVDSRHLVTPAISEKNVLLKEAIPEGSFPLICDRTRLSEVFRTLVLISLEHTNAGGEITIEFIRGREGEVSVRISDNGVGLPAELLLDVADRHYRPGFSVPAQESAMGIGGVHDVVGLHGGRLFVTTKAGEGSTFLFSLPAVQKDGEEKSHDEQAVHSGRRRR